MKRLCIRKPGMLKSDSAPPKRRWVHALIESGHQFSFMVVSSEPFTACLNGNPVPNSQRTAGKHGIVRSKFSMVGALDMRGRRRVVPAPRSKLPRCGTEEGAVGKGGRGVEGGGLAPRMIRRGLCTID